MAYAPPRFRQILYTPKPFPHVSALPVAVT